MRSTRRVSIFLGESASPIENIYLTSTTTMTSVTQKASVEIDDKSVRIGEGNNTVTLTYAEWNDLIARVRRGELKPVWNAKPLRSSSHIQQIIDFLNG